jgi:hypothetical protein
VTFVHCAGLPIAICFVAAAVGQARYRFDAEVVVPGRGVSGQRRGGVVDVDAVVVGAD